MTETASPSEVWKAKAEFQREVYKVHDARLTSFNGEIGVLVTAAVALFGFGAGAASARKVVVWLLVAAAVATAATALLALYARRESPWVPGLQHRFIMATHYASGAVGALHSQEDFSTDEPYRVVFDAWYTMTSSAGARFDLKRAIYNLAVLGLFIELGFVIALLATAEPG